MRCLFHLATSWCISWNLGKDFHNLLPSPLVPPRASLPNSLLSKISVHSGHCLDGQWASGGIWNMLDIFFSILKLWGRFTTNLGFWEHLELVQNQFANTGGVNKGLEEPLEAMIAGSKTQTLNFLYYLQPPKPNKEMKINRKEKGIGLDPLHPLNGL